ncbi:MAG: NifU N-terminal domain-containing protein [Candidatus Paceibacterota bacterium]|jgi:hypothetical protein
MKTSDRITTATNSNGHTTAAKKIKKAKGFQFQVEYYPNPNIITVHTKKMFPKAQTDPLMSCFNKSERKGNQHPLIKSIRRLKGVLKIGSEYYQLRVEKAKLFSWDDLLPKVRIALKNHFADGKELEEIPAQKPTSN